MKQEMKICLPVYKMVYSIAFLVCLSLIRGISSTEEIGIAIDANIALLTIVFCADTYTMEYSGGRWEILTLCSIKSRERLILRRLVLQSCYLCLLAFMGYFLFYWQRPHNLTGESFVFSYGMYLLAITATVWLWAALSMILANLFRNTWAGIGGAVILWLLINSTFGDELLGRFNIFAYSFRDLDAPADFNWMYGKALGMISAFIMIQMIPRILKKRG